MPDDKQMILNWIKHTGGELMTLAVLEVAARFREGTGQALLDEVERFYGSMAVVRFLNSFAELAS